MTQNDTLPDPDQDPRLELIAMTDDTGDPVFEVSIADGSLNVIPADGRLYIHNLVTDDETRLKDLLNLTVRLFDQDILQIVNVINPRLVDVLDGFRKARMDHPDDEDQDIVCLVGRWDPDRHSTNADD